MKCLILAAGYATRLYPLTENFPKPLLKVRDKSILDWLIDDIDDGGEVDEYIVISNHKYVQHFEDWVSCHKQKITVVDDGTSTNESRLGAVRDIQFAIDSLRLTGDILVIAGDNLLDFSLNDFINYAKKKQTSCVMRYYESSDAKLSKSGVVEIDADDRVISMEEKPENPKSHWCCPPFYYYKAEDVPLVAKGIESGCSVDAPGSFMAWLSKRTTVHAMEMPGKRYDIGDLESYRAVQETYKGIGDQSERTIVAEGSMKYDYLIVGSGLYGATFAQQAHAAGKTVLVVEKRQHVAGNVYTERIEGINVHRYGAHIFHTNNKEVWNYLNQFAEFNRFTNAPVANYKGELYSLPFNMYTFNKMWGVVTPEQAAAKIEEQRKAAGITDPQNLEEQAISLVGTDIYLKLVKGYTEKQWGRDCKDLPAFIIKRLPVRFTFDNNYFNALYQGIPVGGYTRMVERMLEGIEVRLGVDYLEHKAELDKLAETVVYTGPIDAYFDYKLGPLEYRSVRFETEVLDIPNFQGNAAVNYTDRETPWTRIIEHKWFEFGKDEQGNDLPKTAISREYSSEWKPGDEPYYPVNDEKNSVLYAEYRRLADGEKNVIFGGRLAEYKYYDMDQVVAAAMEKANTIMMNGR